MEARYFPPDTAPADAVSLVRRGVDHGAVQFVDASRSLPDEAQRRSRWDSGRPIFLPGVFREPLVSATHREAVQETGQVFDLLRDGTRFLDFVEQRLWDDPLFRYAGSTVDLEDEREIEKVFVDVRPGESRIARDLSAKLSWIADDPDDASLRVRFSFGHERLGEWATDEKRALWADEFARRVFPESAVIDGSPIVAEVLGPLLDRPWRLSERIVYSNAPGGGAVFHHDADSGQLGVWFSQLSGSSVWLALSREDLAAALHEHGAGALVSQLAEGEEKPELWQALNGDPSFSARLFAAGHGYRLRPGDALLLPSLGGERVAWHSVWGVGERPSLGHSYGLFPWEGTELPELSD